MNYYKRHLGDYAKDTKHLTTYQHGVYSVLLDWYYSSEKPIPVDLAYRIVQARSGPERKSCDEVLAMCFDLSKAPGFAHSKRADIDIAKYHAKSEANSLIALERESTKRARLVDETCSERSTNVEPSHKPLATSHKEAKAKGIATQSLKPVAAPPLPEWVPLTAWADWHAYRNSRKGWTAGARKLSLRTLTALYETGQDPTAVIEQSIESGWTKLYPVKSQGSNHANPAKLSAAERVLAHAIEGERADRDRYAASTYGRPHLVGSDG